MRALWTSWTVFLLTFAVLVAGATWERIVLAVAVAVSAYVTAWAWNFRGWWS